MSISELRNQLSTFRDPVSDKELVMNTLNGLPPSWEAFIQSLVGQPKLPKFDHIWAICMQEETRLATRSKIHGSQHEESQTLPSHVKRGRGKGRKFHGKKGKGGRSSPTSDQKKKKDLSHVCCYKCNKLGHYARDCDSKKRKHEVSTIDVDEDLSEEAKDWGSYRVIFLVLPMLRKWYEDPGGGGLPTRKWRSMDSQRR